MYRCEDCYVLHNRGSGPNTVWPLTGRRGPWLDHDGGVTHGARHSHTRILGPYGRRDRKPEEGPFQKIDHTFEKESRGDTDP